MMSDKINDYFWRINKNRLKVKDELEYLNKRNYKNTVIRRYEIPYWMEYLIKRIIFECSIQIYIQNFTILD